MTLSKQIQGSQYGECRKGHLKSSSVNTQHTARSLHGGLGWLGCRRDLLFHPGRVRHLDMCFTSLSLQLADNVVWAPSGCHQAHEFTHTGKVIVSFEQSCADLPTIHWLWTDIDASVCPTLEARRMCRPLGCCRCTSACGWSGAHGGPCAMPGTILELHCEHQQWLHSQRRRLRIHPHKGAECGLQEKATRSTCEGCCCEDRSPLRTRGSTAVIPTSDGQAQPAHPAIDSHRDQEDDKSTARPTPASTVLQVVGTQTDEPSERSSTQQLAETALRMQQLMTSHSRMRDRLAARTETNHALEREITSLKEAVASLEREVKSKEVAVKAARKQLYQERVRFKRVSARPSPNKSPPGVMHPAEVSKQR